MPPVIICSKPVHREDLEQAIHQAVVRLDDAARQQAAEAALKHELTMALRQQPQQSPMVREMSHVVVSDPMMDRIRDFVSRHYDRHIDLGSVSKVVNLSPYYIGELFRRHEGIGFHQYLTGYRLEQARQQIVATNHQVSEVAKRVGMKNRSYFCKLFKERYGVSPGEYRTVMRGRCWLDKLIVVEDERWEREGLSTFLDWASMNIRFMGAAANGLEGLTLAQAVEPDIMLTDIRMPHMDGLALSARVKRLFPCCRVLLLTGYDDFSYARDAIRQGVNDYLLKPVRKDQLVAALGRVQAELTKDREKAAQVESLEDRIRSATRQTGAKVPDQAYIEQMQDGPGRETRLVEQMQALLEVEYAAGIDLNTVADRLGMSANRLGALFFEQTGMHFTDALTVRRMKLVEALLLQTEETLDSIASRAGFANTPYFCTVFKKKHGMSPSPSGKRRGSVGMDKRIKGILARVIVFFRDMRIAWKFTLAYFVILALPMILTGIYISRATTDAIIHQAGLLARQSLLQDRERMNRKIGDVERTALAITQQPQVLGFLDAPFLNNREGYENYLYSFAPLFESQLVQNKYVFHSRLYIRNRSFPDAWNGIYHLAHADEDVELHDLLSGEALSKWHPVHDSKLERSVSLPEKEKVFSYSRKLISFGDKACIGVLEMEMTVRELFDGSSCIRKPMRSFLSWMRPVPWCTTVRSSAHLQR